MSKRAARAGALVQKRDALIALALFAAALLLRVLFWRATPDAAWAYSAYYKGDAPVWLEYARALRAGVPFEWGLPLHPPAMGYLVRALWDGTPEGIATLRLVQCMLGALVPPLFHLAAARDFGFRAGLLAGAAMAASSALMILSTSINNETPYLVVVGLGFVVLPVRGRGVGLSRLGVWGALQGTACLFRVEHVLFTAAVALFLVLRAIRPGPRGAWNGATLKRHAPAAAVAAGAFLLVILPWQISAWRTIHRFNTTHQVMGPGSEEAIRVIEEGTRDLPWDDDARAARDRLPGFGRRFWGAFVTATVVHRGGDRVRGEDFRVLEDAFGTGPERLSPFPFITSYGPINFFLGNNASATASFSRNALEIAPPLRGGADRYPPRLVRGLPVVDRLDPLYPPHLEVMNHGYRMGWRWIREHPGDFARLAARKLAVTWSGASLGFTGYGFPIGVGGVIRPVDLAAADRGPLVLPWRLLVLALVLAGAFVARRNAALWPWVFFLGAKLVAAALFFGYARMGATAAPVVWTLVALFAAALPRRRPEAPEPARVPAPAHRRWALAVFALLALAVGAETVRFAHPPSSSSAGARWAQRIPIRRGSISSSGSTWSDAAGGAGTRFVATPPGRLT